MFFFGCASGTETSRLRRRIRFKIYNPSKVEKFDDMKASSSSTQIGSNFQVQHASHNEDFFLS